MRRLGFLLLLVLAFSACEDPFQPVERPEAVSPSVSADAHTLLLLPFDGDLTATNGAAPTQASGLTFEEGVEGAGVLVDGSDLLDYTSAGHFGSAAGTIEFWIKPRWSGNDHNNHFFLTMGDALQVVKDGADNLRFVLGSEDSEAYQGYNLGEWAANEWHHMAVTWSVPGTMTTYVDGVARISHPSGPQDLVSTIPPVVSIGSRSGAEQADAVFDEFRISDIARSAEEIARIFASGPAVLGLTVQPITAEPFETWRQIPKLIAVSSVGTREYPASAATWSSSNPAVATVDEAGSIKAVAAGTTTITALIGGVQGKLDLTVKAPVLPPVFEQVPSYLATPAANSLFEIPVVILRYLPTADGTNLDVSVAPDFWELGPISLQAMRRRIDTLDTRTKFMLEEGSKFRGYRDPAALPSIGYRVVAYITVYEPIPPGKVQSIVKGFPVYQPDYHQMFERFNGKHYVEELGVKEFWFWHGGLEPGFPSYDPRIHKPESFRAGEESNMSSPVTGDISNSGRDPSDLPIYSSTYVLYGQNIRRAEREAVHNHGHQLESMLDYADRRRDGNSDLFWPKFVGPAQIDPALGFKRCGSTHIPPNTTADYDYSNYVQGLSDIADWTPEGIGQKTLVSAHTWGDHPYAWPLGTMPGTQEERNEAHWYIYWMQSMPGRGNTIPFGRNRMTNWWSFTGNWDASIRSGLGLYEPAPSTCAGSDASVGIDRLAGQIQALATTGKLSRAEAHALSVKLDAVARLVDKHQAKAAANVLRAFMNQVSALLRSRRLARADGRPLIEAGSCLSAQLNR